ncbi:ABC transporter permease [Modestobacter versicolor]|uniref:ABC transporter permease n=1 Tax=Modestobacter versicolor TaxID=429133 RepID=UPI0034DE3EBE
MSDGTALRRTASLLSVRRISVIYLLGVIVLIFGITIPDLFLSSVTAQVVASSQAVVILIALAAMLPLIAGEFDITVGTNMALSLAIVCQQSQAHPERSLFAVCVVAVLVSGLVGLVNGFLVVKLRLNSFIATLAMSQVLAAIALKISDNEQIRGTFPPGFSDFGQAKLAGIPVPLLCSVVVGLVLWYVLDWTKLGRQLFATGMNREAARLSGVRTDGLIISSFVTSGLISGAAGIVYATQVGTFSNSVGAPLLFPAFAAVFLGATQFNHRPNVWGTFLAIITLALGVQGLQLSLTSGGFWITPLFNGLALIFAVIFSARQASQSEKASSDGKASIDEPPAVAPPDGALLSETAASRRATTGTS